MPLHSPFRSSFSLEFLTYAEDLTLFSPRNKCSVDYILLTFYHHNGQKSNSGADLPQYISSSGGLRHVNYLDMRLKVLHYFGDCHKQMSTKCFDIKVVGTLPDQEMGPLKLS